MIGEEMVDLLGVYLYIIRPAIAPPDENSLFLKVGKDGKVTPNRKLGGLVTRFAKQHLGLTLTTNTIRAIVDTEALAARRSGKLDDAQLAAVYTVNGHSAETSAKYYQRYTSVTRCYYCRVLLSGNGVSTHPTSPHLTSPPRFPRL